MATAEFSKFADILSAALSQHHLLGFELAQLEFHHTHLESDILECEAKWALGSITMNKASGGDRIPVELFHNTHIYLSMYVYVYIIYVCVSIYIPFIQLIINKVLDK